MDLLNYTGLGIKLQHLKYIHHNDAQPDNKDYGNCQGDDLFDQLLIGAFFFPIQIRRQDIVVIAVVSILCRFPFNFGEGRLLHLFLLGLFALSGIFLGRLLLAGFCIVLTVGFVCRRGCFLCHRKFFPAFCAKDGILFKQVSATVRTELHGKLKKQVREYDVIKRNIDSILQTEKQSEHMLKTEI